MRNLLPKSASFYTRLATSVAAVGAAGYCVPDPNVAVTLPSVLLPAVFTAFSSLFSDLAAKVVESDEDALPDPFQNRHLTKAVGMVVQRVFEKVAEGLPGGEEKTALKDAAECAVTRWQEVEEARRAQGLSVLSKEQLAKVFSGQAADFGKYEILTEAEWAEYVEWLLTVNPALRGKFVRDLYRDLVPALARRLHAEFSPRLSDVLKNYPAAQAGMYLLLLGEIRASQGRLEAAVGRLEAGQDTQSAEQQRQNARTMTLLTYMTSILESQGLAALKRDEGARAQYAEEIQWLDTHHAAVMGGLNRLNQGQESVQQLVEKLPAELRLLLAPVMDLLEKPLSTPQLSEAWS